MRYILGPLGCLILGCSASTPTPAQQAAVAADVLADRDAQKDCIEKADSGPAIDACRDAVKAKRDGGVK